MAGNVGESQTLFLAGKVGESQTLFFLAGRVVESQPLFFLAGRVVESQTILFEKEDPLVSIIVCADGTGLINLGVTRGSSLGRRG